jgi:uncharacterized membrane protein
LHKSKGTLIAIAFPHKHEAAEVLHRLNRLEKEYLLDLEDAVIATREANGDVKLKQMVNLTSGGALYGGLWGALIGLLFTGPLGMLVMGGTAAAFGALLGSVSDYGIEDGFIEELSRQLAPDSSALFVLVREAVEDKVLEELRDVRGTVLKTSLSKEAEAKLQDLLAGKAASIAG